VENKEWDESEKDSIHVEVPEVRGEDRSGKGINVLLRIDPLGGQLSVSDVVTDRISLAVSAR
jgi:hypothetical protein